MNVRLRMYQVLLFKFISHLCKGSIISSKLNSAFSTIGKATADKITAKLVGKTHACHAFAFA